MNRPASGPSPRRVFSPTVPVLVILAVLVAYETHPAAVLALLFASLALFGVTLGVGLRGARRPLLREGAPVPVLAGLGLLSVTTPLGPFADLLLGTAGVAFVAWLIDDPSRPLAGPSRGAVEWALPALAVGLAWTSSFLLPPGAAPIGVAGGLLAAVLIALAYLVRRPELFEGDEAATI